MREFRGTELISMGKPITARMMARTRGRKEEEDHPEPMHQDWAEDEQHQDHEQPHYEAHDSGFQSFYREKQHQGFQSINEELSNMKIQQEQFFRNMQNAQAQYLEELKALSTKQDDMCTQQNNFYRQIRKEQGEMAKEIEEIKKFQVNQTLMGFRPSPIEKLEEMVHKYQNEIIEIRAQTKEWTKNASSREAYCCWAHQQANPNLVEIPEIPIHKITDFVHENAAKGRHIFHGDLKSHTTQGGPSQPSQPTDQPTTNAEPNS
ncbi:hypothetical protein PIB30_091239 [Stylosanthes scabra]|uniref:Uncharacterized protein n=1 Tax=Stylosanthes scabra TaxID=79078 RepID=A0ABU6WSY6_9FABA|nr:hypothetical protein [Stylosanthes scabra]